MPAFGNRSQEKLDSCHEDIQKVLNEAIKFFDFSVLEGIRSNMRQMSLYQEGKSQLDGVERRSKHQADDGISMAVDIMPYYKGFNAFVSENGPKSFYHLAGIILGIADRMFAAGEIEHQFRWGGNWDRDSDLFGDSNFFDLPHFELIKPL